MSEQQLIEAVKAENIASVKELIESGIDVNQVDEQGWTPLNWAAGRGNLDIARLLVEHGADIFKVGRDLRTPYMIALAAGRVEVVKFLREAEERVEGDKPARPERKYCKAYHLEDLRQLSLQEGESVTGKVYAQGEAVVLGNAGAIASAMDNIRPANREVWSQALGSNRPLSSLVAVPL